MALADNSRPLVHQHGVLSGNIELNRNSLICSSEKKKKNSCYKRIQYTLSENVFESDRDRERVESIGRSGRRVNTVVVGCHE